MQTRFLDFPARIAAAALAVAGFIAAATAQANPDKDQSPSPTAALRDPPQQCTNVDAILAKLRFPTGTKFLLTDAGLIVLSQPKAVRYPEPEPWGNSGG